MFNEEIKNQFIKLLIEEGNSQIIDEVAPRYFGHVEGYEQELNKDLSNFSIREIIGMFKYVCTASVETLMQLNSLFKRYTYYCKEMGYLTNDGINHYEEATLDTLLSCTNTHKKIDSIISRKELLSIARKCRNVSDSFLLIAIFEGLAGPKMSDIVNLELPQFRNGKVYLESGRILSVSDELVEFAKESADTYSYESVTYTNLYYRKDDPRILKSLCNTRKNTKTDDRDRINLCRKLSRIKMDFECNAITYGHLIDSGRIDMVKSLMKMDKQEDPRVCIRSHKEELELRYGNMAAVGRFLLKYQDYFI